MGRRRSRKNEESDDFDDEEDDFRGKKRWRSEFIDDIAEEDGDYDEEEDDEEIEDGFIVDSGAELQEEDDGRRKERGPFFPQEEELEDLEKLEQTIQNRYGPEYGDYDDEMNVEQQALLPSVKDPKLWIVKCLIGHEREAAVSLMQKSFNKGSVVQIRSVIALDHLKNYIYVEADKEAHVKEACKGLRSIYSAKVVQVPIKEMTDVLSVESKAIDISRDSWVRMKTGIYKGDIAQVVDVDNVRQRVKVKLIPRIDLQSLANKLLCFSLVSRINLIFHGIHVIPLMTSSVDLEDGREFVKKKVVPAQRPMNIDEASEMHIRVVSRRDPITGDYFENIADMMFKHGFLFKTVSMRSISSQNIQPTFDEFEKFWKPKDGYYDIASFSTLAVSRRKCHFMKGDAVVIIEGDLKDLMGWIEKVEDEIVHIRLKMKGLHETICINKKSLCKYFKPGDHVKVVSGAREGVTGMVIKVEGHVLIIVSDITKEDIRVFSDHVVESSEVTTGVTRLGDYELRDLVLLNNGFGVIIRVESEAFQVLKGNANKPEVVFVKLREIKRKIEHRFSRANNIVCEKDVVRIVKGPYKGKQGSVDRIHGGVLFIKDRHHLEHAGYICVKAQSCTVIGGTRADGGRHGDSYPPRAVPKILQNCIRPPGGPPTEFNNNDVDGGGHRGGRGHDSLAGKTITIRSGQYKSYRGRVVDCKGQSVRVELESQMKVVIVSHNQIYDHVAVSTPYWETPHNGLGSETPMPPRTPLHPYMTPMRDPGGLFLL
ncbi:hypothetical protein IFM89_026209 [Coptis chinensis]|uniref:Transcription elongation factor SPT5 n=1 Tax=Coptis chinensis TaxID=261450 RepID=A0A835HF84_9MAGN|nr:hypothetical protein IFM89_026209 [Coptis chinensis]